MTRLTIDYVVGIFIIEFGKDIGKITATNCYSRSFSKRVSVRNCQNFVAKIARVFSYENQEITCTTRAIYLYFTEFSICMRPPSLLECWKSVPNVVEKWRQYVNKWRYRDSESFLKRRWVFWRSKFDVHLFGTMSFLYVAHKKRRAVNLSARALR